MTRPCRSSHSAASTFLAQPAIGTHTNTQKDIEIAIYPLQHSLLVQDRSAVHPVEDPACSPAPRKIHKHTHTQPTTPTETTGFHEFSSSLFSVVGDACLSRPAGTKVDDKCQSQTKRCNLPSTSSRAGTKNGKRTVSQVLWHWVVLFCCALKL